MSGFSYDENSNPVFIFLNNCINISELEFQEINESDGQILADVFMDEYGNFGIKKRLEVSNVSNSSNLSICISDVSKGFIESSEFRLQISSNLMANLTDLSGNSGDKVFIGSNGSYKLFDATKLRYIILEVFSDGTNLSSPKTIQIFGYKEVFKSAVRLGRFSYSTNLGKLIGLSNGSGIPIIKDKRIKGVISESEISESFIEKFIEGPRNELRSNGVVRGL